MIRRLSRFSRPRSASRHSQRMSRKHSERLFEEFDDIDNDIFGKSRPESEEEIAFSMDQIIKRKGERKEDEEEEDSSTENQDVKDDKENPSTRPRTESIQLLMEVYETDSNEEAFIDAIQQSASMTEWLEEFSAELVEICKRIEKEEEMINPEATIEMLLTRVTGETHPLDSPDVLLTISAKREALSPSQTSLIIRPTMDLRRKRKESSGSMFSIASEHLTQRLTLKNARKTVTVAGQTRIISPKETFVEVSTNENYKEAAEIPLPRHIAPKDTFVEVPNNENFKDAAEIPLPRHIAPKEGSVDLLNNKIQKESNKNVLFSYIHEYTFPPPPPAVKSNIRTFRLSEGETITEIKGNLLSERAFGSTIDTKRPVGFTRLTDVGDDTETNFLQRLTISKGNSPINFDSGHRSLNQREIKHLNIQSTFTDLSPGV